jgi:hypothetical protein
MGFPAHVFLVRFGVGERGKNGFVLALELEGVGLRVSTGIRATTRRREHRNEN